MKPSYTTTWLVPVSWFWPAGSTPTIALDSASIALYARTQCSYKAGTVSSPEVAFMYCLLPYVLQDVHICLVVTERLEKLLYRVEGRLVFYHISPRVTYLARPCPTDP